MRLREATVDRYGVLGGWAPDLTEGVTVLSGPNEAGKSLYLEAVLQLLEADVGDVLTPEPRYDEAPVGRVVLEHDDEQYDLGSDGTLSELTPIQPADLPTVFVVRDNDLAMPDGPDYYTDLVEHLGEIHSSAIASIVGELKSMGRLTDKRLNLSDQYGNAKTTRDDANDLHERIQAFLEEIGEDGIDTLQRERLQLERQLHSTREAHATQRTAKIVHEHDRLADSLHEYETAGEELEELEPFTRERLEELQTSSQELQQASDALVGYEETIATTSEEIAEKEDILLEVDEELGRFERREERVETADEHLEAYRARVDDAVGAERRETVGRRVTVAGIAGTAVLGGAGAVTGSLGAYLLGVALLLVTVVAGIVTRSAGGTLTAVEQAENRALEAARDAGFDVEEIESIAPAIEAFRDDHATTSERRVRTEAQLEGLHDDLEQAETNRDRTSTRCRELEDVLAEELQSVGIDQIEVFERRVGRREQLEQAFTLAEQRLADELGEPDATGWRDRADAFRATLAERVADIDQDHVDPETYDEAQLAALERELEELEDRREELEEELDRYDERLADIDDCARDLDARQYLEDSLSLDGRSTAALRALAEELSTLVETIERDAELSRKAIGIFEEIADAEERKIAELFDPGGPASRAFSRITDGRYRSVDYDTEGDRFVVERADGRAVSPVALSEGTRDQLYFATRLSLANQILDEPGFLFLDDPLVGADRNRLRRGFETLLGLADEGWQIVYLTAKEEVWDGMVGEFDLAHEPVNPVW